MEFKDIPSRLLQDTQQHERLHVDREKSRGAHPPRTVVEQVEQLAADEAAGHRLRDPQRAVRAQRQPPD